MLVRRLDRYVLSAFIAPFIVLSFLIVSLFVVIDLFGRFDDFLKIKDASLFKSVTLYYLYVLPGILSQWLLPIITVIAGLFAVSSLDRHHEITAMLSSGISRQRLLIPLLVVTAAISLGDYFLKSLVVPFASNKLEVIQAHMDGDTEGGKVVRDVVLSNPDKNGYTFWFAKTLYKEEGIIETLFLTRMDLSGNWVYRLQAATARRNGKMWVLHDVQIQTLGKQELPRQHKMMELEIDVTMEDLLFNRKPPQDLSDTQLRRMDSNTRLQAELLARPAIALTSFLLFLWSMVILFSSRSGNFLLAMGHCVLMVIGYYALSWLLIQIATQSSWAPAVILYAPITAFLLVGVHFYRRMPS